jgi:hypothetical protein
MRKAVGAIFLLPLVIGCKKPYNPPVVASSGSYLVVEGVINSGSDSTTIKLSRTVNISSATTANPVLNAVLTIENDQNVIFPLTETTNGNYVTAGLNLNTSHTYRLNIKTTDNKQYQSDFVPVIITPPIDSVGFNIVTIPDTGIQIYANTHDPANKIKYYRWDYDENWAFQSRYFSYYISTGTDLAIRQPSQYINTCYTSDVSSDIVLGSSADLKQDIIYRAPIAFIASSSEKIESEYSILLHEYALTADAYNFWEDLKKNTEQLGSIFDAEPSQIQGNIHCITNPQEPVIGYVSVGTVSSKRIFIRKPQLPLWLVAYPYTCSDVDTVNYRSSNFYNYLIYEPNFIATGPTPVLPTPLVPYYVLPGFFYFSTPGCVDCTIRGSTTPPAIFNGATVPTPFFKP